MGLFWAKYARRIFAIVSTTSIPDLAPVSPTEATVDPPSRGSRLDADHPENGVLIPCRFTFTTRGARRIVMVDSLDKALALWHSGVGTTASARGRASNRLAS